MLSMITERMTCAAQPKKRTPVFRAKLLGADKSQVRLVNESGRIEREVNTLGKRYLDAPRFDTKDACCIAATRDLSRLDSVRCPDE